MPPVHSPRTSSTNHKTLDEALSMSQCVKLEYFQR